MNNNFLTALQYNIQFLDVSTHTHMPNGLYRHFYQWALTDANPRREVWLQLIGLTQLVNMTFQLLDGLVHDDQWLALTQYSLVMNAYQIFEIVSDNLGIGVVFPENDDLRQHLMLFNNAMLARLTDRTDDWRTAMGKLATRLTVSGFAQSLSPDKHHHITDLYVQQHPEVCITDLEYNLFPALVANIETCYMLYTQCNLLKGGALVQAGLRARYESVNHLIQQPDMPMDERVYASADAILVMPTLGYYVAVLADHLYSLPDFEDVVASGILEDALRQSAVLVRLLNDLGMLTTLPADDTQRLIAYLGDMARGDETLRQVICRADVGTVITRLQKDAAHGELNLALHGIADQPVRDATLKAFADRLAYLRTVYQTGYDQMERALRQIDRYGGHGFIRTLLTRFIGFHQRLYSHAYQSAVGEYAI